MRSDGPFSLTEKSKYGEFSGKIMDDIKDLARAAKKRIKSNFWQECKKSLDEDAEKAKALGIGEVRARSELTRRVKSELKGEKEDEFYLRVKAMLDAEGEVSDAIGRLTDREYYETLSYEEKQRYNLRLSSRYLSALERYRREKEMKI